MFINWSNQSQSVLVRSLEISMLIYPKYIRTITFIHVLYIQLHSHIFNLIQQTHTFPHSATLWNTRIIRDSPSRGVCRKWNESNFKRFEHESLRLCIYTGHRLSMQRDREVRCEPWKWNQIFVQCHKTKFVNNRMKWTIIRKHERLLFFFLYKNCNFWVMKGGSLKSVGIPHTRRTI